MEKLVNALGGFATGILTGISLYLTASKISSRISGEVLVRNTRALLHVLQVEEIELCFLSNDSD
jgi:hypothetical protein